MSILLTSPMLMIVYSSQRAYASVMRAQHVPPHLQRRPDGVLVLAADEDKAQRQRRRAANFYARLAVRHQRQEQLPHLHAAQRRG